MNYKTPEIERLDSAAARNKPELADGQLTVEVNPDRRGVVWYLVAIGRARYVKRFNLSRVEAEMLRDELDRLL